MSKVFLSKQVLQYRSTALIIQYAQFRTTYGEASSHQMSAYGTVLEITVVVVKCAPWRCTAYDFSKGIQKKERLQQIYRPTQYSNSYIASNQLKSRRLQHTQTIPHKSAIAFHRACISTCTQLCLQCAISPCRTCLRRSWGQKSSNALMVHLAHRMCETRTITVQSLLYKQKSPKYVHSRLSATLLGFLIWKFSSRISVGFWLKAAERQSSTSLKWCWRCVKRSLLRRAAIVFW